MGVTAEALAVTVRGLHEINPMMGHRGLRLAITYPEIAQMQTTAVIEAALNCVKRGIKVAPPEIMIPLTSDEVEYKFVHDIIVKTADQLIELHDGTLTYLVGTMIEIPRACFVADDIAKDPAFFSFGTNDLTQMGYGFSRDDAGKFLQYYYERKIFESDPFARLDQKGIGKLVELAVRLGRQTNEGLKVGVCGEHGGDPSSIEFFHRTGLDYVSCSPFRVPIARLAAAQATVKYGPGRQAHE